MIVRISWYDTDKTCTLNVQNTENAMGLSGTFSFDQGGSGDLGHPDHCEIIQATIQQIRKDELGLTQVEFASALDRSLDTIRGWEAKPGQTRHRNPDKHSLAAIRELLNARRSMVRKDGKR